MTWFGGAPAIAGFAVANDLVLNNDGFFTSGFEAGSLLHHRGGLLIGHIPKFGNSLRIELIALVLEGLRETWLLQVLAN